MAGKAKTLAGLLADGIGALAKGGKTLSIPDDVAAMLAKQADPAAVRGAEVMDMLRSGRGSDVTDQMLDMGDPVLNARMNEYLYRNYDLPMDAASRMQRAGDMGFDTGTPLYHGSYSDDIAAFDTQRLGQRFDNRSSRAGFWSSTNPDDAEFYGPNIYPVMLSGRYDLLPSMESMYADVADRLKSTQKKMDADFWGEKYSTKAGTRLNRFLDILENDQPPSLFTNIAASNISKTKRAGFDGAILKGGEEVQDVSEAGDNYVTFDPANIRSRFARFDPRLAHLKNLSAGAAGAGLLGAGMQDRNTERGF